MHDARLESQVVTHVSLFNTIVIPTDERWILQGHIGSGSRFWVTLGHAFTTNFTPHAVQVNIRAANLDLIMNV